MLIPQFRKCFWSVNESSSFIIINTFIDLTRLVDSSNSTLYFYSIF